MNKLLARPLFQFLLLAAVTFVTYFPSIVSHKRVDPDAQTIMPILASVAGMADYVQKFVHLETLDAQPVRDLTLIIDQYVYVHFNTNTFAFQNFLWWSLACFLVFQILKAVFPDEDKNKLLIVTVAFSVYPLFSSTVPWGMARKHILTFVFTLISTYLLVSSQKEISKRNRILIVLSYLLAMLSQPISVLWPVWATMYVWLSRKDLKKSLITILPFLALILVGTLLWNNHYYRNSAVFLQIYPAKTNNLFNFGAQLLALGHYIFTLIFPYNLSFLYSLGHWSTIAGLIIIVFLGLIFYKKIQLHHVPWIFFILFPLAPVLTMPQMLQDTYLLIPALGLTVILIYGLKQLEPARFKIIVPVILCWFVMSHLRSYEWLSITKVTASSFSHVPNCNTAMDVVRTAYASGETPSEEALSYLNEFECFKTTISSARNLFMARYLQSLILYFNESIPLDQRIDALRQGSDVGNTYATLYLTGTLINQKRFEEVPLYLERSIRSLKEINEKFYDQVIAKTIHPYCVKTQNNECSEFLKDYLVEEDLPYD